MKKLHILAIGCLSIALAFTACEKQDGAPDPPINPEKPGLLDPAGGFNLEEKQPEVEKESKAQMAEATPKRYLVEMETSLPHK